MFIKFVSKPLRIQLHVLSGCNTNFYIEFCQLTISLKKFNAVASDEWLFCKEDSENFRGNSFA